jgi:DNA (cytosine-5)-methyltransferase 1
MENVPGIVKQEKNTPFHDFLSTLKFNDYNIAYSVLNAKDYGVPQNRRRLVLIASNSHRVSLPEKSNGPGFIDYTTVRSTISKYPPISAGSSHDIIPNHVSAALSKLNLRRIKNTPHDGGDRRSWTDELVLKCHRNHSGHTDVYGRMYWDKPAPTLTSKCISLSNGRYGHPEQDRAISLREAAALQGFPDDYVFYGSTPSVALQIGNAVPVTLGFVVGKHIMNLVNG